ncbi:MAG TPA: hypothetical protein DEP28_05385 [Bacteroidetes bacterium]|nr:hypothetical protein [Bacteroidota bacterium]HCN36946.1 hypothetical protein [Bacteroidota bacterium]
MKKILILFFVLINIAYSQEGNIKEIQILHWNDFHARNTPYQVTKKDSLDNSYKVTVGGVSGVLGYLNKYRDDKTLLLNGGDDFQGSPISTLTKGKSQIELLNLYNLDAFVLGNHEFDYGENSLDSVLKIANFDYISANVYFTNENRTFAERFVIKEVNGVKVGIIGLTAFDLKTLVLPKNVDEIEMLNVDTVITQSVKLLKEAGCDIIGLLTHIGVENDRMLAAKYYGDIDFIIGGHSHTPLFRAENVNNVLVAQAGSYGRWIGRVNLKVDIDKDTVVDFKGRLIETIYDSTINDMNAELIVSNMLKDIEPQLKRVIGVLESDWVRAYDEEFNLGQWEADVVRNKFNTDLAFLNAGGIRKGLSKGDITVGDIWEVNPFGNTIVKFEVSGASLKKMIHNNIKQRVIEIKEIGSSDMLVASGILVKYNSGKIIDGEDDFIEEIKVNGEVVIDNKTYTIGTNNYMAAQFKKYFGDIGHDIIVNDTNILDRDLFIEAVEEQKIINTILEKRIIDTTPEKLK